MFFPKDYVFEWPEVTLDPEDKGVSKEVKAKEGVERAKKESMQSKSKGDKLNRRGAHHFFDYNSKHVCKVTFIFC